MKRNILIFKLLSLFLVAYGQEKASPMRYSNAIKAVYISSKLNGEKFKYETELMIDKNIAQYKEYKKKEVIQVDNYRFTSNYLQYINETNLENDSIVEQRILEDGLILLAKWKADYNWQIKEEFKVINGYKVRKAETKSFEIAETDQFYLGKTIAWFTTDIPISAGPARYSGLPGLILEIEYEHSYDKYTLKSIDFNAQSTISNIKAGELVDKLEVIYYYHNNPNIIAKIRKEHKKK